MASDSIYNSTDRDLTRPRPARVCVSGTWFDNVTMDEAIDAIVHLAQRGQPGLVVTPNLDHVLRARRDPEYAALVEQADLVLADGQPIVWLSRLVGTPLCERVAGSDLFPRLCGRAAHLGLRVFFLGGDPGAAEAARKVLQQRHPNLDVCGTYCPPMGFDRDEGELAKTLAAVREATPDILFVGLGSPKQERWIRDHKGQCGSAVGIGVGISFSFVAGHVKRAPRWLQRLGLEWLHRLCMEPKRLWKRYFNCAVRLPLLAISDLRAAKRRRGAACAARDAKRQS